MVQKDDMERRIELATIDLNVELHEKQKEIRAFLIVLWREIGLTDDKNRGNDENCKEDQQVATSY